MAQWIDSDSALRQLCEQLSALPTLAVDTEFIRTDTFYPQLALIQISDGQNCYLIDVLAIEQFEPLKALLESPSVVLIFHACAEDLEVLDHALDIRPRSIFDTQIAAGLANRGYNLGYGRLVESMFAIQLDKCETRSNWLARPLSPRQLDYAEVDVRHLHPLYSQLTEALETQQRSGWLDEEMKHLYVMVESRKQQQDYYRRIRGAWRLNARSLTALDQLCDWRENIARTQNRPRSRIIKDPVLLEIAKQLPSAKNQLFAIEDWHPRSIHRYAEPVLQQIEAASGKQLLTPLPQPLSKEMNGVIKTIKSALKAVAERQQIPAEFQCNKKELEDILRSCSDGSCQWPDRLSCGWRSQWVKPTIESALAAAKLL